MPSYRADAIVVLGRGVDADGTLPRLAEQRVNRAAELFAWETATRIIFSGRSSLMTDVIPAITEVRGTAEYSATLGLPRDALFVEGSHAASNSGPPPHQTRLAHESKSPFGEGRANAGERPAEPF